MRASSLNIEISALVSSMCKLRPIQTFRHVPGANNLYETIECWSTTGQNVFLWIEQTLSEFSIRENVRSVSGTTARTARPATSCCGPFILWTDFSFNVEVRYNRHAMVRSLAIVDNTKKTPAKARSKASRVTKKTTKKTATKSKTATAKKTVGKKTRAKSTKAKVKDALIVGEKRKREPLGHLLVEQLLREAGFTGGISTNKKDLEKYSTDESIFCIKPQIVLQPRSQRDIEIAVRVLNANTKQFPTLSLTPRAAGTGLSGGSLTDSIVIDVCTFMNHIEAPHAIRGNTTITCEPGAMWRTVEKILKKQGRYLPPYPASKDLCSIGGSIANNAAGPNSLRHGHCADWVASMEVVLYDGHTYTLRPLSYKEYKELSQQDNALGHILRNVFALIEKHEDYIHEHKPKTKKNNAGYALWDVLSTSVAGFKRGRGTFDLTRLMSGSQGTIGILTSVTLKTLPIETNTKLVMIPAFNAAEAGKFIETTLKYDPLNIELFDGLTYDLAMRNPSFFKGRISTKHYCQVLLSMYTMYHVRFVRQIPEFMLLITFDQKNLKNRKVQSIVSRLCSEFHCAAREVTSEAETEMLWQIRRASYSLSKFQDRKKRPAAFLEDMTVPPECFSKFFVEIKKLLQKYNVRAAIHGHGGNGHLHFYPLLDFTEKNTTRLVEKMSEEFFAVAMKYGGSICGEHNDGIIRTPHLHKVFSKKMIHLFEQLEELFDPLDIFNPGKKVHPRFSIRDTIRHTN